MLLIACIAGLLMALIITVLGGIYALMDTTKRAMVYFRMSLAFFGFSIVSAMMYDIISK